MSILGSLHEYPEAICPGLRDHWGEGWLGCWAGKLAPWGPVSATRTRRNRSTRLVACWSPMLASWVPPRRLCSSSRTSVIRWAGGARWGGPGGGLPMFWGPPSGSVRLGSWGPLSGRGLPGCRAPSAGGGLPGYCAPSAGTEPGPGSRGPAGCPLDGCRRWFGTDARVSANPW
jgi:hypothetical protein